MFGSRSLETVDIAAQYRAHTLEKKKKNLRETKNVSIGYSTWKNDLSDKTTENKSKYGKCSLLRQSMPCWLQIVVIKKIQCNMCSELSIRGIDHVSSVIFTCI